MERFHYLLDCYQILWKNLNSSFHLNKENFGLRFLFLYHQHAFHLKYLLDESLISEVMLESEFMFSFAIIELIISEFSLTLIMKYESKPCTVGLLNISFFVSKLHCNKSMKFLPSLVVASVLETYRYISLISRYLHLMFLVLSIAETKISVNEASSSGKVF